VFGIRIDLKHVFPSLNRDRRFTLYYLSAELDLKKYRYRVAFLPLLHENDHNGISDTISAL
jgi:hypothetical protein